MKTSFRSLTVRPSSGEEAASPHWAIAVFSARETASQLLRAVASCRRACGSRSASLDILVNGNPGLARDLNTQLARDVARPTPPTSVRIWSLPIGDKSHAWNTYLHEIWPGAAVTCFIDGYVEVHVSAFERLEAALTANPGARAATGVPTQGRSASRQTRFQLEISGIHGNLYALSHEAIANIRHMAFRLPLGLYRTDPMLESYLKFNLDPSANRWNPSRVVVVTDATWSRRVPSAWRISDWHLQWRRMIRQAQGDVEQQAVKDLVAVQQKGPSELPTSVDALLSSWIQRHPYRWLRMALANPLRIVAVRRACRNRGTIAGGSRQLVGRF